MLRPISKILNSLEYRSFHDKKILWEAFFLYKDYIWSIDLWVNNIQIRKKESLRGGLFIPFCIVESLQKDLKVSEARLKQSALDAELYLSEEYEKGIRPKSGSYFSIN